MAVVEHVSALYKILVWSTMAIKNKIVNQELERGLGG